MDTDEHRWGGRVQETLDIIRGCKGETVAIAMLVDRSDRSVNLGVPVFSLIRLHVEAFSADALPPDLQKIPATKPGSK